MYEKYHKHVCVVSKEMNLLVMTHVHRSQTVNDKSVTKGMLFTTLQLYY